MTKTLYIVRGVPGSGKSTFAKTLGGVHYEADMFFFDQNSNYVFDGSKLPDAHNWCRESVKSAMVENKTIVVVSNTFTQEWEMDAYNQLAKEFGYMVFSIIVENRHGGENQHGVPAEAIQRMKDRFNVKL